MMPRIDAKGCSAFFVGEYPSLHVVLLLVGRLTGFDEFCAVHKTEGVRGWPDSKLCLLKSLEPVLGEHSDIPLPWGG